MIQSSYILLSKHVSHCIIATRETNRSGKAEIVENLNLPTQLTQFSSVVDNSNYSDVSLGKSYTCSRDAFKTFLWQLYVYNCIKVSHVHR